MPKLTPALRELVAAQPWFGEMTPGHFNLIAGLVKTEIAAKAKGEERSVAGMLQFASEQSWYRDGLDETEAAGLGGVFEAYAGSLAKDWPIGPVLASTLRYQLFRVVALPETGDKIIVVSSDDEALGRAGARTRRRKPAAGRSLRRQVSLRLPVLRSNRRAG